MATTVHEECRDDTLRRCDECRAIISYTRRQQRLGRRSAKEKKPIEHGTLKGHFHHLALGHRRGQCSSCEEASENRCELYRKKIQREKQRRIDRLMTDLESELDEALSRELTALI